MADNIPPEMVQRSYYQRILDKTWTNTFKMLPRRILVQRIAPVSIRFKDICNRNVENVHVIDEADRFSDKLHSNDPEANKQMEHLAANNCALADQFRLSGLCVFESSKALLRHSLDLLRGCKLEFQPAERGQIAKSAYVEECLGILESAKPITILIRLYPHSDPEINFWFHPTIRNCSRLVLWNWVRFYHNDMMPTFMNIFNWLHHQPVGMDCADQRQPRCIVLSCYARALDWLFDRCFESFQQSQAPSDRRQFVLSFICWPADKLEQRVGRVQNESTGEVLVLDRGTRADGHPSNRYRLRRCLAWEVADGPEFYANLLWQHYGDDWFNIDEEEATTAELAISIH